MPGLTDLRLAVVDEDDERPGVEWGVRIHLDGVDVVEPWGIGVEPRALLGNGGGLRAGVPPAHLRARRADDLLGWFEHADFDRASFHATPDGRVCAWLEIGNRYQVVVPFEPSVAPEEMVRTIVATPPSTWDARWNGSTAATFGTPPPVAGPRWRPLRPDEAL